MGELRYRDILWLSDKASKYLFLFNLYLFTGKRRDGKPTIQVFCDD